MWETKEFKRFGIVCIIIALCFFALGLSKIGKIDEKKSNSIAELLGSEDIPASAKISMSATNGQILTPYFIMSSMFFLIGVISLFVAPIIPVFMKNAKNLVTIGKILEKTSNKD